MNIPTFILIAFTTIFGCVGNSAPLQAGEKSARTNPSTDEASIHFNRDVRPILAEYCVQCHGPDEKQRKADLRLDIAMTGSDSAIVAGHPEKSEVIQRILSKDPEQRMPPPELDKRLSSTEIEILRSWISAGAVYQGHWAYQTIRLPDPPQISDSTAGEIDRFIIAKLSASGLELSESIDRHPLIRRVTFDLWGLPPTPSEVDAFVSDPRSDREALQSLVDRLLESPRYGERWGRHWLDIARYADTHGGTAIGFKRFPFSYTYRDYVIDAFNADLPYDQFLIEQIAADQLGLEKNDPALAALGFLTVGMQFRSVHDRIDDQIDVVTRGLMGMTVACARCHDHKFDAIPTSDYYALYATLASSHSPERLPVIGSPEANETFIDYQTRLDQRKHVYRDMARDQSEVMRSRLRNQIGLYLTELAKGTPEQDVSAAFLSYRTDDVRPIVLNRWRDYMRRQPSDDPVFGPWVQLRDWVRLPDVTPDQFDAHCKSLIDSLKHANGDPKSFADTHRLSIEAPPWNPRVIAAIEQAKPQSMIDLAKVYGDLFAQVHQDWLQSLLDASLEAAAGAEIVTDEDPRHAEINSAINQQLRRHLYEPGTPTTVPDDVSTGLLNRTVSDQLNGKRATIHELDLNAPGSPPRAMIVRESDQPPDFHVFQRGNPLQRGAQVQPHFLTAISVGAPHRFADGQRRLGLAHAIVDPANPLTRRMIVNWIWSHHFGVGLVRTPDDFGTRGTPPTHPELLDYLAHVFSADGWSIKQMHRRIMLSRVYRQASVEDAKARMIDPENLCLWRMPRRRLEMEALRDAMLAVSGELDVSDVGGRPFDFESDPIIPRRSIYGFINRDIISDLASTFDGADPTACTLKRPDTIVPQQTLFALNSAFIQDRAAAVAKLSADSASNDTDRVVWLYRRLLARHPQADEIDQALAFIARSLQSDTKVDGVSDPPIDRWIQLAHAMLASNEFVFLD